MTIRNRSTARFFAAGAVLATSLVLGNPAEAQQGQQRGARTEQHQARGNRADRAERRVTQLTQRLQLSADQGLKMIANVGSPNLKLHLDTFHMNIEEKHQGAAILKAGKHLGHFHACGTDRGTPGGDSLDWKPIVAALRKIGYKQDVVIESFTTDVKVIARAAAIWRAMEPHRDDIAVKGLKNLNRLFGKQK